MTRFEYLTLAVSLAGPLIFLNATATAQPAVAPSTTIRVIELIDPYTGQRVREVAEDLTEPEIARVQRALASAGFDPGRATGRLDSTTLVALDRFQSSRGLVRCGCVSYETILVLGIRPVVVASVQASAGRRYGSRVLVLAPDGFPRVGVGHTPGVIVGHGPSVFVGHDPARGAGELARRPRVPDRHPVGDPRAPRPRPGPSVSGSGGELRALTPSSRPPTSRPPRTP